eukprot:TRINITY_DN16875_c0_g1_i1.p1 TRINITY_DN16875_c0_g1~~TRINITY_DN16875_c0_g1_i1.p1  ORF type:complete len:191 (-),score=26.06 TRINITY_DN16875_c0_g1_i1:264-836(-)
MHYVLECADLTVQDIREMTLSQFRSILFQVLFALYVAQKEYEFVHNDLHRKNILLVQPENDMEYMEFRDGEVTWYVVGHVVKITDFGLSRIRMDDQRIICDTKMAGSSSFDPVRDVEQVFSEFSKIKIQPNSWAPDEDIETFQRDGMNFKEIKSKVIKKNKDDWMDLRKGQRRLGFTLKELIHHPFFFFP